MKTLFKRVIVFCLTAILAVSACTASVFASSHDGLMAYNIYSNPNLSKTSGGFDTFTIDFLSSNAPTSTYWALCNWNMNLSASRSLYPSASGGGAYAGLQNTIRGDAAIMSFWEIKYSGDQILRASRVYPAGTDSTFGGEGEGTNWITTYEWDTDAWYRMVIHCWEDVETGYTFVGQWVQNRATGEWTLISYFNTKLIDSYLQGGMSQFMENYGAQHSEYERDFCYKNMYVFDHKYQKWVSLATSSLSYDGKSYSWYGNKKGTHEFGATDEYFWGKTYGIDLTDQTQSDYDDASVSKQSYTINQPDQPTFGTLSVENFTLTQGTENWEMDWDVSATGNPQLSYTVELIDLDGDVLFTQTQTRPEVTAASAALTADTAVKCRLTVTDIFGNTSVSEVETASYTAQKPAEDDQTSDTTSDSTSDTAPDVTPDTPSDDNSSPATGESNVVAATMLAAASLAGAAVVVTVSRKKRSHSA